MRQSIKYILAALGVAILALLVMDFNNRIAEMTRLERESERVSEQVTQLVETQTALETQVAYATSEAAVRAGAYEEGRLVAPGDVLVVPLPAGDPQPTPTPAPPPAVTYNNPWEYWLVLFFDREP